MLPTVATFSRKNEISKWCFIYPPPTAKNRREKEIMLLDMQLDETQASCVILEPPPAYLVEA